MRCQLPRGINLLHKLLKICHIDYPTQTQDKTKAKLSYFINRSLKELFNMSAAARHELK